MTDDRSLERAARSWLENGPTEAPDRAVEAALLRIQTLPQERDLRIPWRFPTMTTPARIAAAAVIGVLAVGGALFMLGRPDQTNVGGPGPSPSETISPSTSPSASPAPSASPVGQLAAGTHVRTPFSKPGSDACFTPPQPGCIDTTNDDAISITFTVPDGWSGTDDGVTPTDSTADAHDASLLFIRGASLYTDPCRNTGAPEIPVGPTVDDFTNAVADHPLLEVTAPVDVTLGGYSGKYLELQVPADLAGCPVYRPWEPWYYAQSAGERWHLWILDVDGVRVVIQSIDHAETSAARRAELQGIVDSIQIAP
jgi:hypothetical protein